MSAETNMNVEEIQEEVVQPVEETEHNDVSQEAQEAEQRKRNDAEYNWAEMRRVMKQQQEEIENLKRQKEVPLTEQEKDDLGLNDEDLAEGKHLRSLNQKIKALESEISRQRNLSVEDRIQYKFSDYYEVVTPENIEYLEKHEPELAETLAAHTDIYKKRVAAYKLIKKISPHKVPENSLDRKKALENSQKPVSVNAVTKNSAIGNAHMFENGLTPDLKKQIWKEMQEAMKG